MPINIGGHTFLCIPKTGTTFVQHACEAAGLNVHTIGSYHSVNPRSGICFTAIRNPRSWLLSRWKMGGKFDDEFSAQWNKSWPQFRNNVCFSQVWFHYWKWVQYCSSIIRTENLAFDLVDVLKTIGLPFDEKAIINHPPVNVSK